MAAITPVLPKKFANTKANNDLQLEAQTYFSGYTVKVSLSEVILYSTNIALVFYVGANVFSFYLMNVMENNKQKYMYFAAMLYVTQILYNFLDLNSSNNLDRLQKITGV